MRLWIKVTARASRDEVLGWSGDALRISVTVPPEKGRANAAVLALLARLLGLPRSQLALVSGLTSPRKLLEIEGMSPDDLRRRLKV